MLRGAHVYAAGVLCLPFGEQLAEFAEFGKVTEQEESLCLEGVKCGDRVNVFADLDGLCLKGAKLFQGRLRFLGVAEALVTRGQLFGSEK